MAAFNKFNQFVEDLAHGVHDFQSDQLVVALSNAANAPVAGDSVLADIVQIGYANLSSRNLTTSSSGQTAGTYAVVVNDLVLTASGGAVGPFQHVTVYNDTPASPLDPLVGYYNHTEEVTLNDGETFTIDFQSNLFSIT